LSQPQAIRVIGGAPMTTPAEWEMMKDQAAWIARARIYPALKTPEAICAAMLAVRDMGIAMSLGLACAFEVEGRVGFEVKAKLASLQGHVPSFQWEAVQWDERVCQIRARLHAREPWKEFTYTRAEADRSKYTVNKEGTTKWNWQREPKLMLLYRCLTRWMNLYAIHALMGLPPMLMNDPGDPVEVEFEVLPGSGPAVGGGKAQEVAAAADAPATPAVKPEPEADYRKLVSSLARKQGKTTNVQLLTLVSAVFEQDLRLTPPRTYQEIGPSDWKQVWGALIKRYDPETGQPRPKSQESPTPPATETPAPAPAPVPTPPEGFFEEDEVAALPGAEPAQEAIPEAQNIEEAALAGDPHALIDFAMSVEGEFRRAGRKPTFILEHPAGSGTFYYTHSAILKKCGSTKMVGGNVVAVSVGLESKDPAVSIASVGLIQMLATATKDSLDELEAGR